MWNKWQAIWREPSSKRLAAALLISVLLHVWMVGGLDLALPTLKKSTIIEARLQLPAPSKPAVQAPQSSPVPQAKSKRPKQAKPRPVPPTEPVEPTVLPVTQTPVPEDPQPQPEDIVQAEAQPEPPVTDEGPIINEHPYEYVETYFDIRTKIEGSVEGKAKATFSGNDGRYQLQFVAEPTGITSLILPTLVQFSSGRLVKNGLQPDLYRYQFGDNAEKSRRAIFDWQKNVVNLETAKETKNEPLVEGAQDIISFMYQFMYVAPLQKMQIHIANGKSFKEYDYEFAGEESLKLGDGEVKAYHILHNNTENDEKVELWLAESYQFLPIKIRKIDKEGKVYEFTATKILTARP